jgi:hypothetical protein
MFMGFNLRYAIADDSSAAACALGGFGQRNRIPQNLESGIEELSGKLKKIAVEFGETDNLDYGDLFALKDFFEESTGEEVGKNVYEARMNIAKKMWNLGMDLSRYNTNGPTLNRGLAGELSILSRIMAQHCEAYFPKEYLAA